MVGQGVLRECLIDDEVESVLLIGRSPGGRAGGKIQELVQSDVSDLAGYADELKDHDACFFCLGVSSAGMSESAYRVITQDLTLRAAETLATLNPQMTFIYVSGAGTDSSEKGRVMWARVKGSTENALLRLPFKAAVMFRPGLIQPQHGVVSRTKSYRILYALLRPLLPLVKVVFPNQITTTGQLGRAMLVVAKHGSPKPVMETKDINAL